MRRFGAAYGLCMGHFPTGYGRFPPLRALFFDLWDTFRLPMGDSHLYGRFSLIYGSLRTCLWALSYSLWDTFRQPMGDSYVYGLFSLIYGSLPPCLWAFSILFMGHFPPAYGRLLPLRALVPDLWDTSSLLMGSFHTLYGALQPTYSILCFSNKKTANYSIYLSVFAVFSTIRFYSFAKLALTLLTRLLVLSM